MSYDADAVGVPYLGPNVRVPETVPNTLPVEPTNAELKAHIDLLQEQLNIAINHLQEFRYRSPEKIIAESLQSLNVFDVNFGTDVPSTGNAGFAYFDYSQTQEGDRVVPVVYEGDEPVPGQTLIGAALKPIQNQINALGQSQVTQAELDAVEEAALQVADFNTTFDQRLATSNIAASTINGVIDPANIPASVKGPPVIPLDSNGDPGTLADLDAEQIDRIGEGTIVVISTGETLYYKGSGAKTLLASYVVGADATPDWSQVSGKPTNLTGFGLTAEVQALLADKADAANVYTTAQVDADLNTKQNSITGTGLYRGDDTASAIAESDLPSLSIAKTTGLQGALDDKAAIADVFLKSPSGNTTITPGAGNDIIMRQLDGGTQFFFWWDGGTYELQLGTNGPDNTGKVNFRVFEDQLTLNDKPLATREYVLTQISGSPSVNTHAAVAGADRAVGRVQALGFHSAHDGGAMVFNWETGDFSAEVALDTVGFMFVPATGVAATTGCWVGEVDNKTASTLQAGVVHDGDRVTATGTNNHANLQSFFNILCKTDHLDTGIIADGAACVEQAIVISTADDITFTLKGQGSKASMFIFDHADSATISGIEITLTAATKIMNINLEGFSLLAANSAEPSPVTTSADVVFIGTGLKIHRNPTPSLRLDPELLMKDILLDSQNNVNCAWDTGYDFLGIRWINAFSVYDQCLSTANLFSDSRENTWATFQRSYSLRLRKCWGFDFARCLFRGSPIPIVVDQDNASEGGRFHSSCVSTDGKIGVQVLNGSEPGFEFADCHINYRDTMVQLDGGRASLFRSINAYNVTEGASDTAAVPRLFDLTANTANSALSRHRFEDIFLNFDDNPNKANRIGIYSAAAAGQIYYIRNIHSADGSAFDHMFSSPNDHIVYAHNIETTNTSVAWDNGGLGGEQFRTPYGDHDHIFFRNAPDNAMGSDGDRGTRMNATTAATSEYRKFGGAWVAL